MEEIKSHNFMYVQQTKYLKIKPEQFIDLLNGRKSITNWAFINHDKDDGAEEHYHVILHYDNAARLSTVANLFKDDPERIEIWDDRWNNACGYLIHTTSNSVKDGKYPYDVNEVTANFNFDEKIREIQNRVSGSKSIEKAITQYGNYEITRDELDLKLGEAELAKNHVWISRIDDLHAKRKHERFLKEFEGQPQETLWLWGKAGIGKSRYADFLTRGKETAKLGSSRDYFQDYHGENYVILNDLRPNEFSYADLLRITDPYQHDKSAPRRYHDLKLNLKALIITSPYAPEDFYEYCRIQNYQIDTFEQLKRRLHVIHVTDDLMKQVMPNDFREDDFSDLIGF